MGGSGGSNFYTSDPRKRALNLRKGEHVRDDTFSSEVAQLLGGLLSKFNDRDTEKVQSLLSELVSSLGDIVEGSISTIFGGSVARHTYVDGLSDIDCLLTINEGDLGDRPPSEILTDVAARVKASLPEGSNVHVGNMAVTIDYSDGISVQLLPAVKDGDSLRIASWDGASWSQINPEKFQQALTKANENNAGKLVPTIKLIKAVNRGFPEVNQLSGYHIESLAINVFKQYEGVKDTAAMTEYFFKQAGRAVLEPIKDKSGQSVHVDEELGGKNSDTRVRISRVMDRVYRRIQNANARRSLSTWNSLFNEE